MYYSKAQKFLSSFVIFLLLFGITFRIPFLNFFTYAGSNEFYNLVSIIVNQDVYNKLNSEIIRYSKDIQGVLEKTKVVILPINNNTTAFQIASMNESLYFDGLKGIKNDTLFESKLIGTVLIGDFNLPVVYKQGDSQKTIIPFTDFEDKSYIYNHKINKYEYNKNNINGLKSEIWHGVISPNLGSQDLNLKGLKDYFNKNHNFYEGTGNFKLSNNILNGNKKEGISSKYDPYVFYFDSFRENSALSFNKYQAYEAYLENKEDINFNRFSVELSNKIKEKVDGESNKTVKQLIDNAGISLDIPENTTNMDNVSDIQTMYLIRNLTKNFLQIFSEGTIGKFRADVHNAGRYNGTGSKVNVDMIPYFVTVLDLINDQVLLDATKDLELQIDDIVKGGLSRKIAVPTYLSVLEEGDGTDEDGDGSNGDTTKIYANFLYGREGINIQTASGCSIYRGTTENGGKLVEANRGLDISLTGPEAKAISDNAKKSKMNHCVTGLSSGISLEGWFGRNSPLNIDNSKASTGNLELKYHDLQGAIVPILDIAGSKERKDSNKIYSALSCFDNNFLLANDGDDYLIPYSKTFPRFQTWTCTTDVNASDKVKDFGYRFEDFYKNMKFGGSYKKNIHKKSDCNNKFFSSYSHNGDYFVINQFKTKYKYDTDDTDGSEINKRCEKDKLKEKYEFKFIPSYVLHKSPTINELKIEVNSGMTPNLPIDKNRYIDFIDAKGDLKKIEYPFLYRVFFENEKDFNIQKASKILDDYLNKKSKEINDLIKSSQPKGLKGKDKQLYNFLKIGNYPEANIDLLSYLKGKGNKTITVDGETKTISYYDSLVFAIYWNNLISTSSKTKFVFENYLSDQFGDSNKIKYFLPKNKKEYEIAYLGAPGNSSNMYVKVDPKGKADNPFGNILKKNQQLSNLLLGANIGYKSKRDSSKSLFKCGPPDGVSLSKWLPAIMCRINDMLPPSIGISDGHCGSDTLLLSKEEQNELKTCNGDINKNGINDCLESKLKGGKLKLISVGNKFNYNKFIDLTGIIYDENNRQVKVANSTDITFEVVKLDVYDEKNKKQTVFDIRNESGLNYKELNKYINFKKQSVRTSLGKAKYGFSSKNKDVDITIRAIINEKSKGKEGTKGLFIASDDLLIKIRKEELHSNSYIISNNNSNIEYRNGNSVLASDKLNIYLIDILKTNINDNYKSIFNNSDAKNKLIFALSDYSKTEGNIDISYPLKIKVKRNDIDIIEPLIVDSLNTFRGFLSLSKSGEYSMEIIDNNGLSVIRNFTVLPEEANKLDISLGTNIVEKGGNLINNTFSILDKFNNPVVGKLYTTDISITGDSIVFQKQNEGQDNKNISLNTLEAYGIFNFESKNKNGINSIGFSLKDDEGKIIFIDHKTIKVLNSIKVDLHSIDGKNVVGGKKYKYKLTIRGDNGKKISDFNSRVYVNADSLYVDIEKPYFNIIDGEAIIELNTKTVASKNIPIELQIVGKKGIVEKNISIYPGKPMKVDLSLSKDKLESIETDFSILNVELKDRYGNIVFDNNTIETVLDIPEQYSNILHLSDNKFKKLVKNGKSSYKISGTKIPGVGYFKISTNPGLEGNSFKIKDKKGEIEIKGVGENTASIETFYIWNKTKLIDRKYNAIYTTLLGSSYGDITKKDYLAGSLLFDKDNRALSVTSLLNTGEDINKIININHKGGINKIIGGKDISQDINFTIGLKNNKFYINLYNNALNTYIGKLLYNFSNGIKLEICDNDILLCTNDKKETSIIFKLISNDYSGIIEHDNLIIKNKFGSNLLKITKEGEFIKEGNINFEVNKTNNSNYLILDLFNGSIKIGELSFNLTNFTVDISRNIDIFNSKINHSSGQYKNKLLLYLNSNYYSSSKGKEGNIISYNDPFSDSFTLDNFSRENLYSYENFYKEKGLGWELDNKSLLSFAAGKNVGEATKDYSSFSLINLGDPVISLKKIKEKIPKTTVDRKFDSTIGKILSRDDDIVFYDVFDYDNDSKKDILLIKNNNSFKLLENKKNRENFIDKGNLAYISDLGSTSLVKTGDFTGDGYDDIFFVNDRGEPFLLNNNNKDFYRVSLIKNFKLKGKIVRIEKFDMNNDSKDDIISLDENGDLNIFYGGGTSLNPKFEKNFIANGYGVKLDGGIRTDNAAVYFDGLHQIINIPGEPASPNENTINNLMYTDISFFPDELDIKDEGTNKRVTRTFVKSEYSDLEGIKIEKTFTDKNGGNLIGGDLVNVHIKIKNISSKVLKNIIYFEEVDPHFIFDINSVKNDAKLKFEGGLGNYDFAFRNFDLGVNSTLNIDYTLKVKPLDFGYIKVGLFEDGEAGDDKYGDIIFKDNNENCSKTVEIFRSVNAKTYSKGKKDPVCDAEKNKLPDIIEKNSIDKNNNGIPDYIDDLSDPNNLDKFQEYSSGALSRLNKDSDNDGLPDKQDSGNGSILDKLDNIQTTADDFLNDLDGFVSQLSCGFGGGGCIASPMNMAPLAPGNDMVFNGELLGDGLNTDEGLPTISALTWMYYGPICGPIIWPVSPLGAGCSDTGAGGRLGDESASNFFRLFVTPTLTGAEGTAICFGGPASTVSEAFAEGLSPLMPGGNCIVMAQPMSACSNDGSDGNIVSTGFPDINFKGNGNDGFGIFNGNCSGNLTTETELSKKFAGDYIRLRDTGGSVNTKNLEKSISHGILNKPLFSLSGNGTPISVKIGSGGKFDYSDITKIKKKRVYGFPSFVMEWVDKQVEEIVTKLTDFPTIFIILPDFSGVFDFGDSKSSDSKNVKTTNSGIKEAYDFLSNVPLVNISQKTINISLPWLTKKDIDKAISQRNLIIKQRGDEAKRATTQRSNLGYDNINFDINGLIGSIRNNISILEDYKKIPEKINKLITVKEKYLEQILCNIEIISKLTGGWISSNGDRFKAWVNLYILIKALLKSWQGLIDIFLDFDAECSECKNERGDSQDYIWSLIDAIIPDIPIIKFPKWPDIELDLHNIRAGLDIVLPEFNINIRPMVLPNLPKLYLPDTPNLNIKLPSIPSLPTINIPELPDLPTLPSIELPNLPPPPKLPSMGGISGVIGILKLLTKMMCIMKQSPMVPEWRAGDQIAFITERTGYLSFDFMNIKMPQFSIQGIDKIKVATYVNLEFETDFIVELAKSITKPINAIGSNFQNIFNLKVQDLDFRGLTPSSIDTSIGKDGVKGNVSFNNDFNLLQLFGLSFFKFYDDLYSKKDILLSNRQFTSKMLNDLTADIVVNSSNKNIGKIRNIWNNISNYSYSKEDKYIADLLENNRNKYSTIKDIVNTEIVKTKKLKTKLKFVDDKDYIQRVGFIDNNIQFYNSKLEKYNNNYKESVKKLVNYKKDNSLKLEGERLLSRIDTPLKKYIASTNIYTNVSNSQNVCQKQASREANKYEYKGLYVVEKGTSYRLFDYLGEVDGKEQLKLIDFDSDGDKDIIYMSNGYLFLKENLNKNGNKDYISENPEIIKIENNKFLHNNIFYESVNNVQESFIENGAINISFSAATNGVNNYKLEFYNLVDKFRNIGNISYIPKSIKKVIIDSFVDIDNNTLVSELGIRKNLAYVDNIGSLNGLNLKTNELKNIKDDINSNKLVNLSIGTRLFTGRLPVNIKYIGENEKDKEKSIIIPSHSNIEFEENISIFKITGDAYIKSNNIIELEGIDIRSYKDLPLFNNSVIEFKGGDPLLNEASYIDLKYYDETVRHINFLETRKLYLLDLGEKSDKYNIRVNIENDYFYAKLNSFKNNVNSTTSKQILLSPQLAADHSAPTFSLQSIRIPVYQEKIIDITNNIFEDFGGVVNIKEVKVDLDIEKDEDNNGNLLDDHSSNIEIIKNEKNIKIKFHKFNTIFKKEIAITLIDRNNNQSTTKVLLDVYAPIPNIDGINKSIVNGSLNESLSLEPINIYRFRGGVISKLTNKSGSVISNTYVNEAGGLFNFDIESKKIDNNGLVLKENNKKIAFIDEKTGQIKDFNPGLININIEIDKNINFPIISIIKNNKKIYKEHIEIKGVRKVKVVKDFEGLKNRGIYLKFINKSNYNYYIIPESADINPGALVIYNINEDSKKSLITIFKDGKFDFNREGFRFQYNNYDNYILFKLFDNIDNIVDILFITDGEYIMK